MKNKSTNDTWIISAETQEKTISKKQKNLLSDLKQAEDNVANLFKQTLNAVDNLAKIRSKCKLSNSRVVGIYRELKELEKVMSLYK